MSDTEDVPIADGDHHEQGEEGAGDDVSERARRVRETTFPSRRMKLVKTALNRARSGVVRPK